jgi:hypothetical protein
VAAALGVAQAKPVTQAPASRPVAAHVRAAFGRVLSPAPRSGAGQIPLGAPPALQSKANAVPRSFSPRHATVQRMEDIALSPDEQYIVKWHRTDPPVKKLTYRPLSERALEGVKDYKKQLVSGTRRISGSLGFRGKLEKETISEENTRFWTLVKAIVTNPVTKFDQTKRTVGTYLAGLELAEQLEEEEGIRSDEVVEETLKTGVVSQISTSVLRIGAISMVATPITTKLIKKYFTPIENPWMSLVRKQAMKKLVVAPVVALPLVVVETFGGIDVAVQKSLILKESHPLLYKWLESDGNELLAPFVLPVLDEYDSLRKERDRKRALERGQAQVEVIPDSDRGH